MALILSFVLPPLILASRSVHQFTSLLTKVTCKLLTKLFLTLIDFITGLICHEADIFPGKVLNRISEFVSMMIRCHPPTVAHSTPLRKAKASANSIDLQVNHLPLPPIPSLVSSRAVSLSLHPILCSHPLHHQH